MMLILMLLKDNDDSYCHINDICQLNNNKNKQVRPLTHLYAHNHNSKNRMWLPPAFCPSMNQPASEQQEAHVEC